jgi:hypothetical protein
MKSQAHPARAARKKLLCLTTLTAASIAAAHGTAHRPNTSESFSAVKKMQPPLLRCVLYVKFWSATVRSNAVTPFQAALQTSQI